MIARSATSRWQWPLLVATVALLAACPPPTGRRRGPLTLDGGPCALVEQRPEEGDPCESERLVCDFEYRCERAPLGEPTGQTRRCSCISGRWSCAPLDTCYQRLPDGGVGCPVDDPFGESQTFACSARYAGRTCDLRLFECPNGERPLQPCTCDGNFWQCAPPSCFGPIDSGTRDASSFMARAGQPCNDNAQCAPLSCEREPINGGFCTGRCMNSSSQELERTQCGGANTTCLQRDNEGMCVASCRPGSVPTGCREGFICTGLWFAQEPAGRPDVAGCFPFCTEDGQCTNGARCNTRTGQCSGAFDPMGLADGLPCRVDSSDCRGICLRVTPSGNVGVCGSFIDLAQTRACPDAPLEMDPLVRAPDNMALCAFRRCSERECCPSGLVCEGEGSGFCVPDDPSEPNIECATRADAGGDDARDGD